MPGKKKKGKKKKKASGPPPPPPRPLVMVDSSHDPLYAMVELQLVGRAFSRLKVELVLPLSTKIWALKRKLVERHGRMQSMRLYLGGESDENAITNDSHSLEDLRIAGARATVGRSNLPRTVVYYDFTPFDAAEPTLLSEHQRSDAEMGDDAAAASRKGYAAASRPSSTAGRGSSRGGAGGGGGGEEDSRSLTYTGHTMLPPPRIPRPAGATVEQAFKFAEATRVALEAQAKLEHDAAAAAAGEPELDPKEEKMRRAIEVAEEAGRKRDADRAARLSRLAGRASGLGGADAAGAAGATGGDALSPVHAIDPDRVATASFRL